MHSGPAPENGTPETWVWSPRSALKSVGETDLLFSMWPLLVGQLHSLLFLLLELRLIPSLPCRGLNLDISQLSEISTTKLALQLYHHHLQLLQLTLQGVFLKCFHSGKENYSHLKYSVCLKKKKSLALRREIFSMLA